MISGLIGSFRNVGFWGEGKTEVPGEKPLGVSERTNNKLKPHMASAPGCESGPHWWETSALTADFAIPCFPTLVDISITVSFDSHVQGKKADIHDTIAGFSVKWHLKKGGEIPFWWHVLWIVFLIGWRKFSANQKLYPTSHVRFAVSYMRIRNKNNKF